MALNATSFKPGTSGNAGGNSKARSKAGHQQSQYIRDQTDDGKELADELLSIARSQSAESRDRIAAIKELSDRGLGKVVTTIDISGERFLNDEDYEIELASLKAEVLTDLTVAELLGEVERRRLLPAAVTGDESAVPP